MFQGRKNKTKLELLEEAFIAFYGVSRVEYLNTLYEENYSLIKSVKYDIIYELKEPTRK